MRGQLQLWKSRHKHKKIIKDAVSVLWVHVGFTQHNIRLNRAGALGPLQLLYKSPRCVTMMLDGIQWACISPMLGSFEQHHDIRSSYLSYLVPFLFDVGLQWLAIVDTHHLGHRDRWQWFRPSILLFQVLHHFVFLRLNLRLQLLPWLSQLLLCLLQRSLMVCPYLVPQAFLLLPAGGEKKSKKSHLQNCIFFVWISIILLVLDAILQVVHM